MAQQTQVEKAGSLRPAREQIDDWEVVATEELHCGGCGRFLELVAIVWGTVRIKCHDCKTMNVVRIAPEK